MDKQQLTGAAFVDLKKTFDLVDHHCLLHKLQHYGVRGRSLTWFRNYLTIRSQRVQYGKELSSSLPLDFGVPQGSLLGPLLPVIYINDLPKCLMHWEINMYADDTVIYYTGSHVHALLTVIITTICIFNYYIFSPGPPWMSASLLNGPPWQNKVYLTLPYHSTRPRISTLCAKNHNLRHGEFTTFCSERHKRGSSTDILNIPSAVSRNVFNLLISRPIEIVHVNLYNM